MNELKYEKSNYLITGRYDLTMMEQKLIAYSLTKIRERRFDITEEELSKGIEVTFSKREIEDNLLSKKRGTLSKELKTIADDLMSAKVFINANDSDGNFKGFTIIPNCEYVQGEFKIRYNSEMSPLIANLKENFTVLDYNKVKLIKGIWAVRLYELCESLQYKIKKEGFTIVNYHIVELKLMLGVINSESPEVDKILKAHKSNYDAIEAALNAALEFKKSSSVAALSNQIKICEAELKNVISSTRKNELEKQLKKLRSDVKKELNINPYSNSAEFKRKVLEVAKKELDELFNDGLINVRFEYTLQKRRKKYNAVELRIINSKGQKRINEGEIVIEPKQLNIFDIDNTAKIVKASYGASDTIIDEDELVDELRDLIKFNNFSIKTKDCRSILAAADYDIEKVKKAYEIAKNQSELKNPVGFIIGAIKGDYEAPTPVRNGKFGSFDQRNYDYDALANIIDE